MGSCMLYLRSYNRFVLIGLALLGLSVSSVNASVVSADDAIFGSGSVTRDASSGLDWLDLTLSTSRSYTDVSGQFGASGDFEGWRYATSSEVAALFTSAGGTAPYSGDQGQNVAWIEELVDLWGVTSPPSSTYQISYGITSTEFDASSQYIARLRNNVSPLSPDNAHTAYTYVTATIGYPGFGSALVRTSVVPVPPTVWLFGTALIGLVGFSKRRKAA